MIVSEGQTETVSSSEQTKDAPVESTEPKLEENQDEQDSQMDIEVKGNKPTVTVSWDQKTEEEKENDSENGKRKATSTDETSPSKKTKLINDDVRESLANYFMTQSLLVQDIRLDRSRKHAYIDLTSEMDLTKGLTLNGEMLLDKPMRIAKAKVKSEEKVKVKASAAERRAARDARSLFLKNVPFNATKKDIMKIFRKAANVRFPGGSETANKGIAFVEFKNKTIAKKVQQKKRVARIRDQVLVLERVEEANKAKDFPANEDKNNETKVLSDTLIVRGLAEKTTAETLKTAFEGSLSARVCMDKETGLSKGFGFVEFGNAKNCKAVKEAMQDCEIDGSKVTVEYAKPKVEKGNQGPKGGSARHPAGQPAGQQAARGGVKDKGGRGGGRGESAGSCAHKPLNAPCPELKGVQTQSASKEADISERDVTIIRGQSFFSLRGFGKPKWTVLLCIDVDGF
ncbi:nucleolin [Nibea albiflora]|uniref:Nucleolin n=1 Tax=Nibea albiflora TaxID=240163 RepID=A0ACB7FLL8_NIBAL|nr:nucleolin [Nibea albiflora]